MRSESGGAQSPAQTEATGALREPGEEGHRRPLRSLQNQGRDFNIFINSLGYFFRGGAQGVDKVIFNCIKCI